MTPAQTEWARCKGWIEAALKTGPAVETIEDVEREVASGGYQFWAGENYAVITEIKTFARRKALAVVHGGGDLSGLLSIEPDLAAFARANGCDMLMLTGRSGWERAIKKLGGKLAWIVMYKDLVE